MALRAPWTGFITVPAQTVAAGASVTLPAISIPSLPFLDETNRSPAFDVLNMVLAAQVGTVAANWTIAIGLHFKPLKNGISASQSIAVTGLALTQQIAAAPAMTMQVTATNNGGAPDTIAASYGAAAAPGLTHPDGGSEEMPSTYRADGFGTIPRPRS